MREYRPISGRDFGGAYRSSLDVRLSSADTRRQRIELGVCINGESHGKATHGVKCAWCRLVSYVGAAKAHEIAADHAGNPQPPTRSAA